MLTLGIETSCDETSVSVTDGRKVLSNVVSSSVHLHKKYGGVVPEIASRYHVEYISEVLSKALNNSGKSLGQMELISVTNKPGLVGALLTGVALAKSLSYGLRRPLIGVNHVLAHLYSALLNDTETPSFPFVGLVVSGGHTALFYCKDIEHQKLLGQTQDDAAGEAYDKVAKILDLGYPGGPVIERRARLSTDPKRVSFPRTYLGKGSLDFSFSGIKTAVLYYVRKLSSGASGLDDDTVNDICCAFQEAVLDVLVEKACLAARSHKVNRIVVGGGVSANTRMREKFDAASRVSGFKVYFPQKRYCVDNAAMVGALGEALYKRGHRSSLYLTVEANFSL